jgi:hypothetical protein
MLFSLLFIVSYASLWKHIVQGVIEMVEQLDLLIRNLPINQSLRLFTRPNFQLLTKGVNVIPVFWAASE